MSTQTKNLLPNASFELDFGDHVCTNWGDTQNELSLHVRAADQVPEKDPTSAAIPDAMDGEWAARVETETSGDEAVGHLLSPLITVDPCAPHTISIYARSDQEGAQLEIGLWTGLVDFGRDADRLSFPKPLSTAWQRYHFTTSTDELEECAVVHFKVTAPQAGVVVWFDAAQMERGPQATPFETRCAVEAAVAGRRDKALIHLADAIHAQMSDGHTVMRTRDGGRTWDDLQVTRVVNTVLRDGERAKVSHDQGRTWRDERYFMTATPSYPGYSASCVLPPHLGDGQEGVILSLVGERSERNWGSEGSPTAEGFQYMPQVQAIRWRPVD